MEWISVKDKLPDNNGDCIAITKDETIFMARCVDKTYWKLYFSDNGLQFDKNRSNTVTHWMPLPEPPKS